jgi:hypothetical protein
MHMTEAQTAATRFCARVIGPLLLIVGAIVLGRFDTIAQMIPGILEDAPLSFAVGIFTLVVGLILFAAHHHWSGVTAIVISVFGILTIARGIILMLAPSVAADFATQMLHAGIGAWIAGAIVILIGVWLSYAGWFAKSV